MPVCAVLTCKSSTEDPGVASKELSFHPFPTNQEMQEKWVDMTGRDNWRPDRNSFICSKHFRDNDYFIKRSGNRYLKTAAIPCEYVVYRDLFHQPFDERPEPPVFEPQPLEINSSGYDEHYNRAFEFVPLGEHPPAEIFELRSAEIDSTGIDEHCNIEIEPFVEGPSAPIGDRRSSEIDSTGIDGQYNAVSAINTSPLDLTANMAGLAPPAAPSLIERVPLEKIKRLVSKRKVCKKAYALALAQTREAKKIKFQLQNGTLNDYEKANAIIMLQTTHIEKLKIDCRRLRKLLKKISAVLRTMKTT